MINLDKIKGIIFDYGATIDSNGKHWAEVLWDAYQEVRVPVTKEAFRDAYVYGERYLATHPVIQTFHTFYDLLIAKTGLQVQWLINEGFLEENNKSSQYSLAVSNQCYNFVRSVLKEAVPVIQALKQKYPLVLVSNFYGNIGAVLKDFGLDSYFDQVIESAVVKVRKPDPVIFEMGVKALGMTPEDVVVVGDSYKKDIVPARTIGCSTIWIKGPGWGDDDVDASADLVITDFKELRKVFQLDKKTN